MDDFIRVKVRGIFMSRTLHGLTPLIIIANEEKKIMPIYVGMSEGVSINSALKKEVTPRPMTHDLMTTIIERLDASVNRILIDEIKDGIYYARLALAHNGVTIELDARPSDCISLAVRTDAPIMVRRSVFDASVIAEEELEDMLAIDSLL